ncbi:echinoidin-like [Lytechinus variegatus]|uniref:echinoidin-like n=1 Tax=Lytechinus variegatus TaxID=7654 RepID=UPI001BB15EBA|nr:echinoidin-like [Lytechinus variegatus]
MKTLVIFLFFAATLYTYANPVDYACPHGWTQRHGFCYRFFEETLPWSDAETRCHEHFDSFGIAHLVSIHDQAENDFIYQTFISGIRDRYSPDTNLPSGIWIGFYQEVQDGPWVWSDGSSNDFNHWLPGQPDNGYHARGRLNEDCVIIWRIDNDSESTRQWDDVQCNTHGGMSFVCKMPAVAESNNIL